LDKGVQTLDRALNILELLAVSKNGMGVTEIGQKTGLHKSTAHRLLNALFERGYVEKAVSGGTYKIGLKIVELSGLYFNNVELKAEAADFLRKLADESTQSVQLAAIVDGEVVYIEKVDAFHSIRMYSQIGKRAPAHCTAVGKAILMGMSNAELEEFFRDYNFKAYTKHTKTSKEEVLKDIEEAKQKGYSVDDEEYEEGIRCIGAPIYDYRKKVIAGVCTSGSRRVISPKREKELKDFVIKTAGAISRRMGYNP